MLHAYASYQDCVNRQVVITEDHQANKIVRHTRVYPCGFHHLPFSGGTEDQPYRLMQFFHCFMTGEREAFYKP